MRDRKVLGGNGIGGRPGAGPVVRMAPPLPPPSTVDSTETPAVELARARAALAAVAADLTARAGAARAGAAGGTAGEVLDAQALMAADPALDDAVAAAVDSGRTAAAAVFGAFDGFRAALVAAGGYLAERVADLDDVRQRVVAACLRVPVPGVPAPGYPYVLVAHDLAPADTAGLDLSTVVGLVTVAGGPTSHTAVLARARGIPAVVNCAGAAGLADGTPVLVDPAANRVVTYPGPQETVPRAPQTPGPVGVGRTSTGPGRTADGLRIALLANVSGPADVGAARAAGAEGVGLYRTELLFLDAARAPDEAGQVAAYRAVFDGFPGQRVVVRVLDAGADKPLAFLPGDPEPNPALGVRGLRALRRHPDVLHTQLAAIATARRGSAAQVWVMAPMVADAAETAWFVEQAARHGLTTAGVMVEVPSAAMLADQILSVASFASIGTNDLAQYGLAVDRQAGGLASLQDPWHPGLLRLVDLVGRAGRAAGRPVGVCGEAAADPQLARVLVGLGVTSLSMAPPALADVRTSLAQVTERECRAMATHALAARSAAQARAGGAAPVAP
jgi:phosphoenolpyruvate-protein phosphotransferase (PTS system enzyme I)